MMGATAISLSESIANFRMLIVSFKIDYNLDMYATEYINIYNSSTQPIRAINLNTDGKLLYTRVIKASSGTSLSVDAGYYTAGLNTGLGNFNGALVPNRVWGMK